MNPGAQDDKVWWARSVRGGKQVPPCAVAGAPA